MNIPKIIHQTWKTEDVPLFFRNFINSWKIFHPEWKYVLWTDDMNLEFIKRSFPDFLKQYVNYDLQIQRVDAVRYFILYKFGGVFVDLDFECLRNVQSLLDNTDCVFGKESEKQGLLHNKKIIISNAFMASIPKAEFFRIICKELNKPLRHFDKRHYVLESTGPFMVTRLYREYGFKFPRLKIIEAEKLYPLSQSEVETYILNNQNNEKIKLKLQQAYAMHYYWGSWWKECDIDSSLLVKYLKNNNN